MVEALQRSDVTCKAAKLDSGQLHIGELISEGVSCDVHKGKYQVCGPFSIQDAVKQMNDKSSLSTTCATRRFKNYADQATAMAAKSDKVCPVLGHCMKNGHLNLVMQLCEGSLQKMLSSALGGKLDYSKGLSILEKVASALQGLHQQGIMHLNLKPGNILVGEDGQVLLADVGFTPDVLDGFGPRGSACADQMLGPANYMSPEYLSTDPKAILPDRYLKADSWSFGTLMLQVLTGVMPFAGLSTTQSVAAVGKGGGVPVIPSDLPAGAIHLLKKCFKKASKRPSMPDIAKEISILRVDCAQSFIKPACSNSGSDSDSEHEEVAEKPTSPEGIFCGNEVLAIVNALNSGCVDTQENAVTMLAFMALTGEDVTAAIKPLVKMVDSTNFDQKWAALGALMNISSEEGGKQAEVAAAGAISKLLHILRHSNREKLQKRAMDVMTYLASQECCAVKIAEPTTVKLLMKLAKSSAAELRQQAVGCMGNMAAKASGAIALALMEAGIIPVLVKLLDSDLDVDQLCSATALANMAGPDVVAIEVMEKGAIPKLLRLLSAPSDKVRQRAVCALANLSSCREFALAACSSGASSKLAHVMMTGNTEAKMLATNAMMKMKVHQAVGLL